ncbi:hypothetical protein GCM10010345_27940 [Streptomyces canarius]|uniref:Uncharacterized protein n=1 Tax=Streptomyces canarius TaxID=285453 RepID=A0ABQ3CK24_9ACTN|nr:hypothetical protein GCM10010345_27940 [Streptomyces canarius]
MEMCTKFPSLLIKTGHKPPPRDPRGGHGTVGGRNQRRPTQGNVRESELINYQSYLAG